MALGDRAVIKGIDARGCRRISRLHVLSASARFFGLLRLAAFGEPARLFTRLRQIVWPASACLERGSQRGGYTLKSP